MPPSGPSASFAWQSNNSVQLTTAHHDKNTGGGINMMNNNRSMEEHDVIGSLGKALSSVNIAEDNNGRGSVGGGQGNYGAPGTAVGSHPGSWSGLSGSAAPAPMAPAGLSYNYYGNNNNGHTHQPPTAKTTTTNEHDSLQNILYDSGIYEKEEVAHRRASTGTGARPSTTGGSGPSGGGHEGGRPTTPVNPRERKPSIDIFLSRSPSKTLGEDAFRVGLHRTNSNPSLDLYHNPKNAIQGNGPAGGLKPLASTAPSSRSESPQTVRSNGMSATSSPYNANGRGGGMYNPSQFTNNNFSPGGGGNGQHGSQLHAQLQQQPSLSSQFSNSSNNVPGLVTNGSQQGNNAHIQQVPQVQQVQQQQPQQQQYLQMPVSQQQQQQQQQPQVFYMAVPAPDGKGQVLQPVQMVQMPGQPGTLMMPMAAGSNGNQGNQGGGGGDQGSQGQMMLMQPSQGNNGMGNMNNGAYRQDNGNNNQYPQYGNNMQQQQSRGYDAGMNRYQSKNNNAMDNLNLNGGQYQDQGGNLLDPNQQQQVLNNNPGGSLSVLYSSPQRPPLRSLLGNVRRLSRDQVGCRLLQQALDEDGPSAATAILNEGLTFWAEAMVDPFGNYLFQKILERITPEERVTLVSSVSTRLVNASLNLHGTRSVQKIVEVCAVDEENEEDDEGLEEGMEENKKEEEEESTKTKKKKKKETAAKLLTDALKPSAARLCIDSHGNHAIQRILLKLPYQYTQFIFDAVAASVEDVARHRHGCCVIQRCLDSRHSAARTHLVGRIVEKSLELMQDAYGNYVVQYVLDVCGDDEVHAICESVIGKVCLLAIQKFSSNVMEKCLERCTDRVREEYLNELNDSDRIRELMMDPFGNYVVQRALSVSTHAQAIRLVETMKPHLSSQNGGGIRNTAGGRRILGKICRRFPNFVLEGETFEDYDLNQVLARGSPHHPNPHGGGGGGGGGGRRGGQNQFGMPPHPGPSPNHRRNGRNNRNHHQHHQQQQQQQQHNTIPQYQQQSQTQAPVGHHVNVQPSDMNQMPAYHQAAGANPYLFPHSM